jgi:aspartate aminotransferase
MILSKNMERLVAGSSTIRKLFEEGVELAKVIGSENVYDFSLGNPAAPVPAEVKESIYRILENDNSNYVHGYMLNAGYEEVREKVANHLNLHNGTTYEKEDIIMTVGAAGGLNCLFRSILEDGDEVLCFAPYFGEYRSYVMNYGGVLKVVPADFETFQLNLKEVRQYITPKTKAVIINNPNNPSGVIYKKEVLEELQRILEEAEREFGHPIYVVSDEPYRELVYDDHVLPFAPAIIKNCIVVYSFSKSLSLSGERIGYMAVSKQIDYYDMLINALVVANRCLGYINAPSLFQLVVADCLEVKTDIAFYDRNRKLLYETLTKLGFQCVKPEGAFYLLIKSPVEDETVFADQAKKHNILLVPAASFGCPGYVRLAYCVSHEMILRSLPAFEKLAADYSL